MSKKAQLMPEPLPDYLYNLEFSKKETAAIFLAIILAMLLFFIMLKLQGYCPECAIRNFFRIRW